MNNKVSANALMYSNFIKFERMFEIIKEAFAGSNCNNVDFYIDVYSILKPFYQQAVIFEKRSCIFTGLINCCAHYRQLFSGYGVNTRFFIIYSDHSNPNNKMFVPNYNFGFDTSKQSNVELTELISDNIDLLEKFCPYLPEIYFFKSDIGEETGSIITSISSIVHQEGIENIVLTKDVYNYQLAGRGFTILRPKKTNNIDASYYINQNNVMNMFLEKRRCKIRTNILNPGLLPFIMALTSVPERNIKSLINMNTAIKIFEEAVQSYRMTNEYHYDIHEVWNAILCDKLAKVNETLFTFRFKAIDLQFQSMVYINSPELIGFTLVDLSNPELVKFINDRFFKDNPIDILSL